jgi:hypothetical protein
MADDEPTTIEQITEYESQLAGIVELLEESPGDESLLALKKDMEELLELSRANIIADADVDGTTTTTTTTTAVDEQLNAAATNSEDLQLPPPPLPPPPIEMNTGIADGASPSAGLQQQKEIYNQSSIPTIENNYAITNGGEASASAAVSTSKKEKPHKAKKSSSSKKQKKVKDFVMPDHLVPTDDDTDAERNKKRRAGKALKNKWRLQKKEIESNNRKQSWHSFQKKSGSSSSSSSGSIFATKEGLNDRVGVVSKKQLTEFGARKRHK